MLSCRVQPSLPQSGVSLGVRARSNLEDTPMAVLSDAKIRALKPKAKPFKRADFDGLYLLVNPSGSKLWRFKYRLHGKEKLLALGKYPDVTLAQVILPH